MATGGEDQTMGKMLVSTQTGVDVATQRGSGRCRQERPGGVALRGDDREWTLEVQQQPEAACDGKAACSTTAAMSAGTVHGKMEGDEDGGDGIGLTLLRVDSRLTRKGGALI